MQSLVIPAPNYWRCENCRLYCTKIDVPGSGFSLFKKILHLLRWQPGGVSLLLFMRISRSPFQHNLFSYFGTAGQACAKGPRDIRSIPSTPHPFSPTPAKGQAYFKPPRFCFHVPLNFFKTFSRTTVLREKLQMCIFISVHTGTGFWHFTSSLLQRKK